MTTLLGKLDLLYKELLRLHSADSPGMNSLSESAEPPLPDISVEDLVRHSRTWGSLRLIFKDADTQIRLLREALANRDGTINDLELKIIDLRQQVKEYKRAFDYSRLSSIPHAKLTERIVKWVHRCLGEPLASNEWERGMRLVEEAMEFAQTCGVGMNNMYRLADYVNSRPVGKASQEAAGVLVTLLAACHCKNIDIAEEVEREVSRIEKQDDKKIQDKQAFKASISTGMIPAIRRFPDDNWKFESMKDVPAVTIQLNYSEEEIEAAPSRYQPEEGWDGCD